ncbi:MAG TPA: flagellar biosynthesis protein FlhB [Rhodocyclaceae bacterium]|nr:flagellar biosynthesis protein FlhB [Rhodocyclaceae bacterium]
MAEDSDLEKTEPASGRKVEQAREQGNVPRSKELSSFLVTVVGVAALWTMSGWMYQRLGGVMRQGFTLTHEQAFEPDMMGKALLDLFSAGLITVAPLLIVIMIAGIASHIVLGGFVISGDAFKLDFTRMNPISGVKRLVSITGLVELVKGVFKSTFILGVAGYLVWHYRFEMLALMNMPLNVGLQRFSEMLIFAAFALCTSLALIAAIDVPYQLWHYWKELRMTKQEIKDEHKESEGDPKVKGKIRQRQQEMARRRMMEAVPKADVVVTNPTHFAVALKYESGKMGAPTVVAKGADFLAQTIRDLAKENNVPLLESPPLARALFHHAKLDQQIPAALYTAVAEVMAYIYQLNQFIAEGGLPPPALGAIEVPEGMDPGVDPSVMPH